MMHALGSFLLQQLYLLCRSCITSSTNSIMASVLFNYATQLCLVCGSRAHPSNKRIQCSLCNGWTHLLCIGNSHDATYFRCKCVSDALPFLHLNDDDVFYDEMGLLSHGAKIKIAEIWF